MITPEDDPPDPKAIFHELMHNVKMDDLGVPTT